MNRRVTYSLEVRERAVRIVLIPEPSFSTFARNGGDSYDSVLAEIINGLYDFDSWRIG